MKQTVICAFDMGESFGVNDYIFDQDIMNKLGKEIGLKSVPGVKLFGVHPLIGRGITIQLDKTYKEMWKDAAYKKALSEQDKTACIKLFNTIEIVDLHLDIYALGICFLRMDIEGISDKDSDIIMKFYESFEYSGYESFSLNIKELLIKVSKFFQKYQEIANTIAISTRFELSKIENNIDIFPGFVCINICEENDDKDKIIEVTQTYEETSKYEKLCTDSGVLYQGWASAVICDCKGSYERNIFMYELSLVYYEASKAFDKYFTDSLTNLINNDLYKKNKKICEEDISTLKLLSNTVIQLTSFTQTSESISDRYFYKTFDKVAQIELLHNRIRDISAIFTDVQYNIIERKKQKRENLINKFILSITLLTFTSVMSDVIGTVDYFDKIWPSPAVRLILLLAPTVLAAIIILFVIKLYFNKE